MRFYITTRAYAFSRLRSLLLNCDDMQTLVKDTIKRHLETISQPLTFGVVRLIIGILMRALIFA